MYTTCMMTILFSITIFLPFLGFLDVVSGLLILIPQLDLLVNNMLGITLDGDTGCIDSFNELIS